MDYDCGEAPTRTLVREGSRPLRWDLAFMEIGDTLLVPTELMSFQKTYLYVKTRQYALGKKFDVKHSPAGAVVTRIKDEAVVDARFAPQRPESEGQPVDWGVLEKQGTQWRWPFAHMELGDVFRVDPGDITIAQVRARAYNASWASDGERKFMVVKEGSWIKVQRVTEPHVAWECVKYGIVRERVAELYEAINPAHAHDGAIDPRLLLDMVTFPQNVGEYVEVEAQLMDALPKRTSYIFEAVMTRSGELTRFAIDMHEDGFRVTQIEPETTQQQWDAGKLDPDPFS